MAVRIVKTEGVCGGDARVDGTRIPVWGIVAAKNIGKSDGEILLMYPALTEEDLANAFDYAKRNADEISRSIQQQSE